jgi:hypothetical protein
MKSEMMKKRATGTHLLEEGHKIISHLRKLIVFGEMGIHCQEGPRVDELIHGVALIHMVFESRRGPSLQPLSGEPSKRRVTLSWQNGR